MIEPIMYFGIGFLVAALLGLLFVPLVHNRAVRLTMRRLEAATPLSIAEIRADKDQLRAEFAMSTRRLEMSVEQMKAKTTGQLAELGKKTDAINQLKKELGEKTATIFAMESRDKNLRDQLRATEEEFELKSASLREAERALADKEAELARLVAELGERSIMADSQRVELAALRTQVEAMKVSVADYERAVRATEERLARERGEAETAAKLVERGARQARRTGEPYRRARTAAARADDRSRGLEPPRTGARNPAGDQGRLLAEREFEITQLRGDLEAARKIENDLREELENAGGRSSGAVDKFRADIGQLEAQLAAAIEERTKLQREIAAMKRDAEADLGRRARRKRAAARTHQRCRRRSGAPHRRARRSRIADRVDAGGALAPSRRDGPSPGINGAAGAPQENKGTLADRIRALQSSVPRAASS